MFKKYLKKTPLKETYVKGEIERKLIRYINQIPEDSLYEFPDSGAGGGNMWKMRIGNNTHYRVIYYAEPLSKSFYISMIYNKQHTASLTKSQLAQLREKIRLCIRGNKYE